MTSPYLVPVAALLRNVPSTLELSFHAPFDEDRQFSPKPEGESDVDPDAVVAVAGRVESFRGGLMVRAVIRAPWHGQCRRCSAEIDGILEIPVEERFVPDAQADDEAYGFSDTTIDLSAMVHDAVFLELPLVPLCRAECQGLCPHCGVDRNEAPCTCQPAVDPRWAMLSELQFDDDSSSE